jgi:hypothetical protein
VGACSSARRRCCGGTGTWFVDGGRIPADPAGADQRRDPSPGQIDDVCRVVWITAATGPPPDSQLNIDSFWLGSDGVEEVVGAHRRSSGERVVLIGAWHTHPYGLPRPTPQDGKAFDKLLANDDPVPTRLHMTIHAGPPPLWERWLIHGEPPVVGDGLCACFVCYLA